jgi:hypothetical protein
MNRTVQRFRRAACAASMPVLIVFSALLLTLAPRAVFGQG